MKWLSACVEVCQKNTVMFVWIQSGPNRNHWDGNNPDRILNHTHTVRIYDLAVALTLCRQYTTWLIKAHSNTSTYVHVLYISMYCDKYKVLFHCAPDKQGRGEGLGVDIFSTGIFSLYYKLFWCDSWLRRKTPLVHQFLVRWRHQSFLDLNKHSTVLVNVVLLLHVYSLQSRCWESESKFVDGGIRCCGVCSRGREMFDLRNKECVHNIANPGIA